MNNGTVRMTLQHLHVPFGSRSLSAVEVVHPILSGEDEAAVNVSVTSQRKEILEMTDDGIKRSVVVEEKGSNMTIDLNADDSDEGVESEDSQEEPSVVIKPSQEDS